MCLVGGFKRARVHRGSAARDDTLSGSGRRFQATVIVEAVRSEALDGDFIPTETAAVQAPFKMDIPDFGKIYTKGYQATVLKWTLVIRSICFHAFLRHQRFTERSKFLCFFIRRVSGSIGKSNMSISIAKATHTVLAGLVFSLGAVSVSADALKSQFSYRIVEANSAGEETLVERDFVKPGEVIHYQLLHENTSNGEMAGLIIAAPVPQGVTIETEAHSSSLPAVFEVQAEMDPEQDGLEWSTLPAVRRVSEADGSLREEPLPADEIVGVRWTLSEALDAGKSALNTYRVRVN